MSPCRGPRGPRSSPRQVFLILAISSALRVCHNAVTGWPWWWSMRSWQQVGFFPRLRWRKKQRPEGLEGVRYLRLGEAILIS